METRRQAGVDACNAQSMLGACAKGGHAWRRGVKQGSTHATLHALREGLAGFALIKGKMECARGTGACAQGRHACRRGVKQGSTHATLHACKCFSTHPVQASYLQVSTSFRQVSGLGNPVTQHPSLESAWVSWPSRRICPWRGACVLDRETTQADSGLGCLVTGLPKDMSTHATLNPGRLDQDGTCERDWLDLP